MFNNFKRERFNPIDSEIDAVTERMRIVGVNSDEYPKLMGHLLDLTEMKAKHARPSVSPDTVALVLGNLAGILVIVAVEQRHVFNSKGLTQLIRPKGMN